MIYGKCYHLYKLVFGRGYFTSAVKIDIKNGHFGFIGRQVQIKIIDLQNIQPEQVPRHRWNGFCKIQGHEKILLFCLYADVIGWLVCTASSS